MTANLDATGAQAQQVIHPDDRVRGTLSICGRGACTYLQQIPPKGSAEIGPFLHQKFLRHLLAELVKNLTYFAVVYAGRFPSARIELLSGKAAFLKDLRVWATKCLGEEFGDVVQGGVLLRLLPDDLLITNQMGPHRKYLFPRDIYATETMETMNNDFEKAGEGSDYNKFL